MSKEKSQNPITKDSKVTDKEKEQKKALKDHTDEELDAMGWEEESKLWADSLLSAVNDNDSHGKSN